MLTIKVEAMAGEDVRSIIEEMCIVATRTGCLISANVNSVTTMAKPGADPREIYAKWKAELESKRPYKMVCGQPMKIARNEPWDLPRSQLGKT